MISFISSLFMYFICMIIGGAYYLGTAKYCGATEYHSRGYVPYYLRGYYTRLIHMDTISY